MPHGSCPAMTGSVAAGSPPIAAPPFARRYWCRSLPHMPEAFISTTTSPSPGVGTFADVLRDKSEEARTATSAWHAVRLKPEGPDLARACFGNKKLPEGYPASHGPKDNCVVDKIEQFAAELKDPDASPGERL